MLTGLFRCFLILGAILLMASSLFTTAQAQPAFRFSYDASGNRVKREVIDLSDPPGELPGELTETSPEGKTQFKADKGELQNNQENLAVDIYPNPFEDWLRLEVNLPPGAEEASYKVWYADGRPYTDEIVFRGEQKINMQGAPPGSYLLEVRAGKTRRVWEIVKD